MRTLGTVRVTAGLALVLASSVAAAQPALPATEPAAPSASPAPPAPPSSDMPTPSPAPPATEAPASPPLERAHEHAHDHAPGHGHGPHHDGEHQGHDGGGGLGFGGLGYLSVGMMTGGFSGMQNTLSSPNVFGGGYEPAPTGLVFGGGGGVLLGPVWVGAKGFGLLVDSPASSRGTAKLSGFGAGGEIGYALVANRRWLVVPFFGVGGFGYNVAVANTSSASLPLYPGETIGRGGETPYTAGFVTGELGLRANRLLFFGTGGITVGAEIGYLSSLQRAAWESSTGTSAPESAELRGGYFRLVIGGGAFGRHENHHPEPSPNDR